MKITEAIDRFDFKEDQNLFFVNSTNNNPYIHLALEEAKTHKADAVYFRFFSDNRPPKPQAYIYDYISSKVFNNDFSDIHRNLWLSGKIPLIYVFTDTDIKIFNAYEKPDYNSEKNKFEITTLVKIADYTNYQIMEYSAKNLDNGTFWDMKKQQIQFDYKKSSYGILLYHLKNILDRMIESEENKTREFYQRLLLRSILIKYLEEREDENGNTIFPDGFFGELSQSEDSFISVLKRPGAIVELFRILEEKFNGKIFTLTENEKNLLLEKDLSLFVDVFDGRINDREQLNIWRLYSFNYLPVELISNIYEEFLEPEKGVIYTPPFLVDFLIDQCIPLENEWHEFKVLDPACGSGVFLVAAYKRLVQKWRFTHEWENPDIHTLKKILKESIYGIDIKGKKEGDKGTDFEATKLAAFSLNIALCDQLSPKTIWKELSFDDLTVENLLTEDFFEIVRTKSFSSKFDLVIGNPPFISKLTTPASEQVESEAVKERGSKLPDNQLALLFLEQSISLTKPEALICMIQPAGPFLYNKGSFNFRKKLIKNNYLEVIFDFSSLHSTLFEKANVSSIAVLLHNAQPLQRDIMHITVRRTKSTNDKLFFELDKYDFHKVNFREAIENKLIWKSNLLGGGRLNLIAKRFQELRTFDEYLEGNIRINNWVVGEGFTIGNRKEIEELVFLKSKEKLTEVENKKLLKYEKKYSKAEYLTGKKFIPSKYFDNQGINNAKIVNLKEEYFIRPRKKNKNIFYSPHLLIKKSDDNSLIPIEFRDDYLCFTHGILGVHCQEEQKEKLKKIETRIKGGKLYIFLIALCSSYYLIDRSKAFLKADILSLPYPEDENKLKVSLIEKILIDDVLCYQLDFHRNGVKAKILNIAPKQDLIKFSEIYCQILNSVYKKFSAHKPIYTSSFICFPFYYGEKPEVDFENILNSEDSLEKHLNSLILNESNKNLRIIRILRIYEKNVIYLIKPNQLRYWLRSIAVRDADDTYADLIKQGF